MAKEIEINLEEENNVSMEVKDTGNVEIGMESDLGGTTDYNKLKNKPSINGVTLEGNKTLEELGIINYDDTEIKENITEIEKENTYQNKRLEYLEKNQIQSEVKGEDTLTITDGAFAYANILKETEIEVEGEKKKAYLVGLPQGLSRQEQREGYNLFNSEIETQTIKGVEVSYDKVTGYIKLNGTVETDIEGEKYDSTIFNVKNSGKILVQANIDYTLSIEKISGTYSTNSQLDTSSLIQLWDSSSGTWLYPYQLSFYNLKTSSSVNITKSQTTDVIYNQIQLTLRDRDVFNNLIIGIQFNEGELKPFEQYGETPSIEIPSEIENVKAWNLFNTNDTENIEMNKYYNAEGTKTYGANWNIFNKEVKPNSIYYLSGNNEQNNTAYIVLLNENKDFIKTINSYYQTNIIQTTSDTKYIGLSYPREESGIIDINTIMLVEEKDKDKPYAPYGAISIGLENKNLAEIEFGGYSQTTGEKRTDHSLYRNIKPIKIGNNNYFLSQHNNINIPIRVFLYDEYMNFINSFITNSLITINNAQARYFNWQGQATSFSSTMEGILLEEGETATSYTEHQEQNYNLHLGDLELNGIDDIRDSFVVELDNSYSYKKVKKLYLKKNYDEYIFNGTERATGILNKENFIKIFYNQLSKKIYKPQNNGISSVGLLLSNYFKVLTNPNTQWSNDSREDITVNTFGNITFSVSNNIAKTEEEFKAKLLEFYNNSRPVKITYRLNEPELIDLTEDYPQLVEDIENIINNIQTYEETTHIDTSIGYMEITYTKSNKLIIKNYDDRISALEQAILSIGGQNV